MAESIEDGTTVPLSYTLAPNEMLVDPETLEREFLSLAEAEGVSDIEELNKVLDKAVTLKTQLKAAARVEKVAAFVEHAESEQQVRRRRNRDHKMIACHGGPDGEDVDVAGAVQRRLDPRSVLVVEGDSRGGLEGVVRFRLGRR